jgi:hypothetical protein
MTPSLRTARICTAAATVLGLCAVQTSTQGQWLYSGLTAYGAAFLAWCAACERRHHRWILTRHENARRAALELEAIGSCCQFAEHSGGQAHGIECRRPPDQDALLVHACCVEALVYRGAEHAPTCPTRTTRSNAA